MTITKAGQAFITRVEFDKGCAFLAAAELLKPRCGTEPFRYVYLHLICQGLELLLKSALLAKDFGRFEPKMRRFGHDLKTTYETVAGEFGIKLPPDLTQELDALGGFYRELQLRYGGLHAILRDPFSIRVDCVLFRTRGVVKLMLREFNRVNYGRF